jgi:hypothetical protein
MAFIAWWCGNRGPFAASSGLREQEPFRMAFEFIVKNLREIILQGET